MNQTKYYYNENTCGYELVKLPKRVKLFRAFLFTMATTIVGLAVLFAIFSYFPTPKEYSLSAERNLLDHKWTFLAIEENNIKNELKSMQIDDEELREILELDSLPSDIRDAGIGGTDAINLEIKNNLIFKNQILTQHRRIDKLKAQLSIQALSFDTITKYAEARNWNWSHIPAIQPISHHELRRLSTVYGMRMNPVLHRLMPHRGFDFMASKGTPVYATADGTVILARMTNGGFGNQIVIDHQNGYKTRFAHLLRGKAFAVKKGDEVKRGQIIGYLGNSGRSAGPHLHYEVLQNGRQVNPIGFFQVELNPEAYDKMLELAKTNEAPMD